MTLSDLAHDFALDLFADVADRTGAGIAHRTYRLLSPAALDRVLYCAL